MKHIYLNLKRFDVPVQLGGVNRLTTIDKWGSYIVSSTQDALKKFDKDKVEFVQYFPEAHLFGAIDALDKDSPLKIGCQSVYRNDTAIGGNFGAFTSLRPASAMTAIGCSSTIIGHCEERNDKTGILGEAGITDMKSVNHILNKEILAAQKRGMNVLYCVGEKSEEQDHWEEVIGAQLTDGLKDADISHVVIGYEPIWSIGPGKTPADKAYITKIASFIKKVVGGIDVVYGGGLKTDNAEMLASIPEIDGGLIALTRFKGEIGFYPDEYIEIIHKYLNTKN